jgi:hypothetical protein
MKQGLDWTTEQVQKLFQKESHPSILCSRNENLVFLSFIGYIKRICTQVTKFLEDNLYNILVCLYLFLFFFFAGKLKSTTETFIGGNKIHSFRTSWLV